MKLSNVLVTAVLAAFPVAGICFSGTETRAYGEISVKHTPEKYDSLLSKWYESTVIESYDRFLQEFINIDPEETVPSEAERIPDSVYEARLRMIASVIQLPYNDVVRQYILAYTGRFSRSTSGL